MLKYLKIRTYKLCFTKVIRYGAYLEFRNILDFGKTWHNKPRIIFTSTEKDTTE